MMGTAAGAETGAGAGLDAIEELELDSEWREWVADGIL
jgi:hypothetical protein